MVICNICSSTVLLVYTKSTFSLDLYTQLGMNYGVSQWAPSERGKLATLNPTGIMMFTNIKNQLYKL